MSISASSASTHGGRLGRLLRTALNVGLLAALRFGPAGVAGVVLKSVARRPLKMVLAVALEPALARLARYLQNRFNLH